MCWIISQRARAWARGQSLADALCSAASWAVGPMLGVGCGRSGARCRSCVAGGFAAAAADAVVLDPAAGQWQADHPGQGPALNPLAYLGRFFAQPRLIAGWLFAVHPVLRLVGLCRLSADLLHRGGSGRQGRRHRLSLTNALLFTTPLMLRWCSGAAVRRAVRAGPSLLRRGAVLLAGLLSRSGPGDRGADLRRRRSAWCCWTWRAGCRS